MKKCPLFEKGNTSRVARFGGQTDAEMRRILAFRGKRIFGIVVCRDSTTKARNLYPDSQHIRHRARRIARISAVRVAQMAHRRPACAVRRNQQPLTRPTPYVRFAVCRASLSQTICALLRLAPLVPRYRRRQKIRLPAPTRKLSKFPPMRVLNVGFLGVS